MILKIMKAVILITLVVFNVFLNFSTTIAAIEQSVEELDQLQTTIERQNKTIKDLQRRINEADGILKKALDARLDKAWLILLEQNIFFAESVVAQQKSETEVGKYQDKAIEILVSQTEIASTVAKRIRRRIVIPDSSLSAAEQAAAYTKVFNSLDNLNLAYNLFIQSLELSRQFKIDVTEQELLLKKNLEDRVANGSILLDIAIEDVAALNASVAVMPDDAESKAKLAVAKNRVLDLADKLNAVVVMMDGLGMDTSAYQEQIISATGQITTDLFNFGLITNLLKEWGKSLWNMILEGGPDLIFKILLFIIIIYVFFKIANIIQKLIEKGLTKSHLQLSELLRRMVLSIVRNIIIVLGILIALSQIGISLGPLLAGLGVVGFIIGFALQDSLSNFAAGMMILIYRPFDVGDLIEAGGESGKVNNLSLVNTTILTLDNQTILIPNNKIWGDVIKNVTAQTIRRIDMIFGISYSDDIQKTERILKEILDSHDKVLSEPEALIRVNELADSSVNFAVRPWVKKDDYLEVYWDITRSVKVRFDEEGISIPFPQRDVHVYNHNS
ncbi:MAG: mechanosensitive ion channel family protein [Desulfobulbales bacterium]